MPIKNYLATVDLIRHLSDFARDFPKGISFMGVCCKYIGLERSGVVFILSIKFPGHSYLNKKLVSTVNNISRTYQH